MQSLLMNEDMNKLYITSSAAAAAIILIIGASLTTSCSQDQTILNDISSDATPVRLVVASASPKSSTRATADLRNQRFDVGETFEAYFGTSIIFQNAGSSMRNTIYDITTQGVSNNDAEPRQQPYVKRGTTTNNKVQAYFPNKAAGNAATFTVSANQYLDSEYNNSDLMYAEGTVSGIDGVAETTQGSRTLVFHHRLGCIVVNATAYSDLRIKEIQVITGQRSINITDRETFTLAASANTSVPITTTNPLYLYKDDVGRNAVRCAAMVPAQQFNKDVEALCVVTDKGKVFFRITTANLPIAPEHRYILNLYITHVDIGGTCLLTINNWTPDGEIELTRGEEGSFVVNGYPFRMLPVNSAYSLGMVEVTNRLYKEVMGSTPGGQSNSANEAPVSNITYAQAQTFVNNLNTKVAAQLSPGWQFAIPTLDQWTFAAHGGNYTHGYFYAGTTFNIGQYAWYSANSTNKTQPVSSKLANELGFFDMSGNVSEWVSTNGANGQPLCVGGNYATTPGTELAPDSELYIDHWTTSQNGINTADKTRGLRLALVQTP